MVKHTDFDIFTPLFIEVLYRNILIVDKKFWVLKDVFHSNCCIEHFVDCRFRWSFIGFFFIIVDASFMSSGTIQAPSLGVVVYQLRQCANHFMSVYETHKQHLRKLQSLADLSTDDLKQVL